MLRKLGRNLVLFGWALGAGCYGGGGDHDSEGDGIGCDAATSKYKSCGMLSASVTGCQSPLPSVCEVACIKAATCEELNAYECGLSDPGDYTDCLSDCYSKTIQCPDNSGSFTGDESCDGTLDCANGADEQNCPTFTCDDRIKIKESERCDGSTDCSSGEDETDCSLNSLNLECNIGGSGGSAGFGAVSGGGTGNVAGVGNTGGGGSAGTGGIAAASLVAAYNDACTRIETVVEACAESGAAGAPGAGGAAGAAGAGAGGDGEVAGTFFSCAYLRTVDSATTIDDCGADCFEAATCTDVLGYSCSGTTNALWTCIAGCYNSSTFDCNDGFSTLAYRTDICDGYAECYYNTADETGCTVPPNYVCPDGFSTIYGDQRCDGYVDCYDGTDEVGCICGN